MTETSSNSVRRTIDTSCTCRAHINTVLMSLFNTSEDAAITPLLTVRTVLYCQIDSKLLPDLPLIEIVNCTSWVATLKTRFLFRSVTKAQTPNLVHPLYNNQAARAKVIKVAIMKASSTPTSITHTRHPLLPTGIFCFKCQVAM